MSIVFSCALVALVCFFSLCGVITLSTRYGLFIDPSQSDKPQRFHHKPTPRAGGVGIILGVIVGFGVFGLYAWDFVYFLCACLVVFMSGFLEDTGISLSPKIRLVIQCVGALLACVWMQNGWLQDLGFGFMLPYVLGLGFSVFAVVGVANAMNIIDGFNGLSGGVALCVCISITGVALQVDMPLIATLAVIIGSAVFGFLLLNFPNGKIFLGDGGAYFLGFALAMVLILLTQEPTSIVSPWYGFCVMIYPIWEVLFSIFRKKLSGRSPMQPDPAHLHMLLFKRLGNNPLSAFIIVCANIPFIALATLFYTNTSLLMLTCGIFVITYMILYRLLASTQP